MNLVIPALDKIRKAYWLIFLLLGSCANPVSPTGGPKDVAPPKIESSYPANPSTNFTGTSIEIEFSEFVALKDITSQLIVSPPLKEKPIIQPRGKSLVMKFKEPWLKETTYNLFFGDAIVDITEGNKLSGYTFTFSTGPVLDSMMIKGKLINAFDLTPVKEAFVMLYDTVYDSIPYKQIPYYVARTNDKGEFDLTHLRNKPYLMFAITDMNTNYLYDMPGEQVAFLDTLVNPWYTKAVDTIVKVDTNILSTEQVTRISGDANHVTLYQFKEIDSVQSLVKSTLLRQNVISFSFKLPVKNPGFVLLSEGYDGSPVIGKNPSSDTLTLWLPGYTADSAVMVVKDLEQVIDTVEMLVIPRAKTIKKADSTLVTRLTIKNNIAGGKLKPTSPLHLVFQEPVKSFDPARLVLMRDSVIVKPSSVRFIDSINTRLAVTYPWKEGEKYSITINDSSFVNLFEQTNDSIRFQFAGMKEEETARVVLNITVPEEGNYIVQLLDSKEKVLERKSISNNSKVEFKYLTPGKYRVKVIIDKNRNGYWDTGNYLKKRFPEKVVYYNVVLELRANWTMEEEWNITEPVNL